MNKQLRMMAANRGHGEVIKVIHTAKILHSGWEMDNAGWIVRLADHKVAALTTSHEGVYAWLRTDLEAKIRETEDSLASLRKALELFPT